MPEKAIYSLTDSGEKFEKLMLEITCKPIHILGDFNAVIVNLTSLSPENKKICLANLEDNIKTFKTYLEENICIKENNPEIPEAGKAILQQQFVLAQTIEEWIAHFQHILS